MAEFNYAGATYARSNTGMKKLIANLQGDIDKACKAMTGNEYSNFIKQVRTNWSGVDAEAFIKNFQKDIKDAQKKIKAYSSRIQSTLERDNNAFRKMQKSNVSKL